MAIGRVRIAGDEKWVGFIGGGYNNDAHANRGKGFFVVDLGNGNIVWSYTRGDNPVMSFSIPASPVVVDTDNDGFVDTAYVGDLGGNVWRFKFCTRGDGLSCSTPSWGGGLLFQSSSAGPIYTTPAVARGSGGSTWVFWGTGNINNPTATDTQDRFFGLKDDRASTYTINQLENITNSVFSGTNHGWYINHAGGEKVLADSSVFGGVVTWTTYTLSSSPNPCIQAGEGKLYAVAMMPVTIDGVNYQVGAGVLAASSGDEVGSRSISLGTGIAKMPIFSQKPGGTGGTDFFVTISGGGGTDTSIISSSILGLSPFKSRLQTTAPSSQVLHWRDGRIQ
jgi:Tfp pilus tip-associated adhesin PilY1